MRFPTLHPVYFGASAKPSHWQARRQPHHPITSRYRKSFSAALPFKLKRYFV